MKALIGRDTDGWGTRGFVARLENGQTVTAANATELVRQLRVAGVDAITVAISDEGDRSLSAAFQQELMEAWRLETGKASEMRRNKKTAELRKLVRNA